MNIQELCKHYYTKWMLANKWALPDLRDSLDFLATECAEAIDVGLRLPGSRYSRTHSKTTNMSDVAEELFDVIFMACMALDVIGCNLMDLAHYKLLERDKEVMARPDLE